MQNSGSDPFARFEYGETGILGRVGYDTFGCRVFKADPPTPDELDEDIFFDFGVHTDARVTAPDGRELRFWGFRNLRSDDRIERDMAFPSPMMRVRQGQIVHVRLRTSHGPHTIHFHAIEPTPMNDGVGHVSFEVGDSYTYQWQATEVGTYFYHCHRNTVLHFEMGMVGPLIIDPPEGPGVLYSGGPTYQVERAWIVDDVDPRWNSQNNRNHDQGLCGEDAGFNRFEPKYFLVNGIFNNKTMTHPKVKAVATLGETILIRVINASYSVLRLTFGIDVQLVGVDGRLLGRRGWNQPATIRAGTTQTLTTAGRFDFLIRPSARGSYPVRIEFIDWIKGTVQDEGRGVVNTQIRVV